MVFEITEKKKAAPLFAGWQETLVWSCLQGPMGHIYGDDPDRPVSAMALLGDFCFFAGRPRRELVRYKPQHCRQNFVIMVPRDEDWAEEIEACFSGENQSAGEIGIAGQGGRLAGKEEAPGRPMAKKVLRYAIRKEPEIFQGDVLERLQTAVETLPEGCELKMMDEELFLRCREISWCRDWVSQYADYRMYRECGLGAVILKDNEPVSGASSYSGHLGSRKTGDFSEEGSFRERKHSVGEEDFREGRGSVEEGHFLEEIPSIEIEIDTREDCRRQGLAYICGAKLILECLKRGWYPSWDAQNMWSVALAEKLGYHFDREYTAYEIWEW